MSDEVIYGNMTEEEKQKAATDRLVWTEDQIVITPAPKKDTKK